MKELAISSVGAIALVALISFASDSPVLALHKSRSEFAQQAQIQPDLQIHLEAKKKVWRLNHFGIQYVSWQPLQGDIVVHKGDVVRYFVIGKNNSSRSVKNLVVTQPIPKQTVYILNSLTTNNNKVKITYSIDNGMSFVEKPIIQSKVTNGIATRSAPAALYTHLRWEYNELIAPAAVVNTTFQVKVR